MPRLSRAQMETRQRIVDLSARNLLPQTLAREICEAMRHAIPNDGYRLFGLDPATRLINRTLAASDNDVHARHEWLREIYLSSDPAAVIDFSNTIGAGISITAYHERLTDCWGLPDHLTEQIEPATHRRLYHETGTPDGGVIFASFGTPGRWQASLQLYRRETGAEFRRGQVSFLQLMAPKIGQALASAFAREQALTTMHHSEAPSGIWLLERNGRVRYQSPAAENWGRLLADTNYGGGSPVPAAVWSAVASLHAGKPIPVQVSTANGLVRVEASVGGDDGSVAVVLTPHRPPPVPEIPPEWGLTQQERQVVELLVQGLRNVDIARRLSSSERTIESHLSHVYAKLEVTGRTEVIASFFLRTYFHSAETDALVDDACSPWESPGWDDFRH